MLINESNFRIEANDGQPIDVIRWAPAAAPVAVLQIAHGMGEHPRRYKRLADALLRQGYVVYANAHRGHGESAAADGTLGDFGVGGFNALVDDMAKLSIYVQTQHPDCPLILFGHSMGSFASQLYLLQHSRLLSGAILSGSAAVDLLAEAIVSGFRLEDMSARFKDVRTPFDWLSRDAAEVDKYIADPLCGFTVTPESMQSMFAACAKLADIEQLRNIRADLPIYLFSGDHDAVNNQLVWFNMLICRYQEAGIADLSYHVFGGARHETLNEINREEVTSMMCAWIKNALNCC